MSKVYVHGYAARESQRLQDQANALVELLHSDTRYQKGDHILEAGCGVGAQTVTLAGNSPDAAFTSIDISGDSIAEAKQAVESAGLHNVTLERADIFSLQYEPESFDHVFLCHVLEHLSQPVVALEILKRLIKPGGTITVIEGDHGSAYFYPASEKARLVIQCQVELQSRSGGNALIGRELYPLLSRTGFDTIRVDPRMVYADATKPGLAESFTRDTFTAMIEGVREAAIGSGIVDSATFDAGIRDLKRTAQSDGVFCYTFFKATAVRR